MLEAPEELALGDLDGPETGQMIVLDLAVEEHVAPALETLDEVDAYAAAGIPREREPATT